MVLGCDLRGYCTPSIARQGGGGPQLQLMPKWAVTAQLSVNSKGTKSSDAEYEKAHSRAWAGLGPLHPRVKRPGGERLEKAVRQLMEAMTVALRQGRCATLAARSRRDLGDTSAIPRPYLGDPSVTGAPPSRHLSAAQRLAKPHRSSCRSTGCRRAAAG